MNIENLKKVRADIAAAKPEECDMRWWDCGSVCCIGGFTTRRMVAEGLIRAYGLNGAYEAQEYLELDDDEKEALFFGYPDDETPPEGWQAWMVQRLTKIIETGEV